MVFPVPAVNIVVTYDAEAMIAFQETGDFQSFKAMAEKKKKQGQVQTFIFTNAPGSNFLSLSHSYGKGGSPKMTIEIIDPQGVFEKAMLDNSVQGNQAADSNILGKVIEKRMEDFDNAKTALQKVRIEQYELMFKNDSASLERLAELATDEAALEDQIEAAEDEFDEEGWFEADDNSYFTDALENEKDTQIELMKKQLQANSTQVQRPVYIAYGVGDNFQDWAPAQCFGRILKIEYSFDGTGARTLKLGFSGKGGFPNLLQMGINPLGVLADGTITKGISQPIFNSGACKQQVTVFNQKVATQEDTSPYAVTNADVEKYVGDYLHPSLHKVLKDTLTSYIAHGTNYRNVLVVLPDLDHLLGEYMQKCVDEVTPLIPWKKVGDTLLECITFGLAETDTYNREPADVMYFQAFKEALEGLGLNLSETRAYPNAAVQPMTSPVGENVWESLEECDNAADALAWFETRKFTATVQCDYVTQNFTEKLESVGKAINKAITETKDDAPKLEFNAPYVETDLMMLKIMHENGLISTFRKPCIIWGDKVTIDNFLQAKMLEYNKKKIAQQLGDDATPDSVTQATVTQFASSGLDAKVHPLDILDGLDLAYMTDVMDYVMPLPWIGPFGPNLGGGQDQSLLNADTGIAGDTNSMAYKIGQLKNSDPMQANRMPVFTFGTQNPNVLGVDIDIDNTYMALLNNAAPSKVPAQQMAAAIIPPGFKSEATEMFADMEGMDLSNLDDNGVPEDFKPLVDPFYDVDWFSGDDIEDFEGWAEVFNHLGPEAYKDMDDKSFYGSDAKEDFYKFMWDAFSALYEGTHDTPLNERMMMGKNPANASMTHSMRLADRLADITLTGKITTTPMFGLSTDRRVVSRSCLLYCIEPRFTGVPPQADDSGNIKGASGMSTWFSGLYQIFGFKHTISGGKAESEFHIARGSGKGSKLTKG